MIGRWWHRLVARVIFVTKAIDIAYRLFDRARSRAVVRWVSDETLAELNALTYQADATYDPDGPRFRSRLFSWEVAAVEEHFGPAPGRVLLGGAGGGREAFALAERGYEVIAFEPARELAAAMARRATSVARVDAFRAGYEDLPRLCAARPGDQDTDLQELGRFSAAIFGWGSFSHLMTRDARLRALRTVAAVTDGPILVSFNNFGTSNGAVRRRGRVKGRDNFSIFIGYYHTTNEDEFRDLVAEVGLDVIALNTDQIDSSWPHAVLRTIRRPTP